MATGEDPKAASREAKVVAVTATYRRPFEVERLLRSLEASECRLHALVIVDNASDEAIRTLAAASSLRIEYFAPKSNLGCGGGLGAGERLVLEQFGGEFTHLWILDDDAVVFPETLGHLLEAMAECEADVAHPLTVGPKGDLGWFPGLTDREKFRAVKRAKAPEDFISQCGADPTPFSWSQGIALLVSRRALEQLGFHRGDYWVRGEDLEFSLRITHRYHGIYVPNARVRHLPPEGGASASPSSADDEYRKHLAMLQNIAYTSLRLPHGRRIARTIPGNWWRFVRTWGAKPKVLADVLGSFWNGAIRGNAAGTMMPQQNG